MARYRELLKTVARRNDAVNGWFICDRGRFSNTAVNGAERPRQALVDGQPVSMDAALDAMMERLSEFLELHGPGRLAIVGSPRMSLEGNIMAARLAEMLGTGTLSYFGDVVHAERTLEAVSLLHAGTAASQEDVQRADLVAVMECDLLDEAPMMALALRQAWRNGAQVFIVGSECPIDAALMDLFESTAVPTLTDVPLASASRPVVICGTRHKGMEQIRAAAASGAGLAFILDGPNAFGCALLAVEHGARSLSLAVADRQVKGIISFEADLPDELLEGITVVGAADWRSTGLLARAEVVLPTSAWVEQDGTFVNNEGRAQRYKQVMRPGLPIKGLTTELHPPRVHRHDAPGGDVLPSWRIIAELVERLGGERITEPLDGHWENLRGLDAEGSGILLNRAEQ